MTITEGQLKFTFNNNYQASKYDTWAHYRNQFGNNCSRDNKAVDFIAFDTNYQTLWLCEVKDFRVARRSSSKPPLEEEIAVKVRDTLAGIISAKFRANNTYEQAFAANSVNCKNIRVVLHLEQSQKKGATYDLRDLTLKLKNLLKGIDPHVIISTLSEQRKVPWTIT